MATLSEAVLRFVVDKGQAEAELRKVEGSVERSAGKMARSLAEALTPRRIFIGLATGAAAAFGQLANVGIQHLRELDAAQARFRAQTGASAEEAQQFQQIIRRAFRENVNSVDELAAAAVALRREMALTTVQVGENLQLFIDFAKITGQDLAGSIRSVDDAMDAWGLRIDQAGTFLDRLKKTSELTGADVGQMLAIVQAGSGQFQALGLSLDDVIALLGKMAEAGIAPESSLRGLSQAAAKIKSPAEFDKLLRQLGAIEDPSVRARKAIELFGARAGPALARLLTPSGLALDDLKRKIADSEGTVTRAGRIMDDNFNTKAQLWRKRIIDLGASVGGPLFRALGSIGLPLLGLSQLIPVLSGGMGFLSTRVIPVLIARLAALRAELVLLTRAPWTIVLTLAGAAAVLAAIAAITATVQGYNKEAEQAVGFTERLDHLFKAGLLGEAQKQQLAGGLGLASALASVRAESQKTITDLERIAQLRGIILRPAVPQAPGAGAGPLGGPSGTGTGGGAATRRTGAGVNRALQEALRLHDLSVELSNLSADEQIKDLERILRAHARTAAERIDIEMRIARLRKQLLEEQIQQELAANLARLEITKGLAAARGRAIDEESTEAERAMGRLGASTARGAADAARVIEESARQAEEAFDRLQDEIAELVKSFDLRRIEQEFGGLSSEARRAAARLGQANAENEAAAQRVLDLTQQRLEHEVRLSDLAVDAARIRGEGVNAALAEANAARERLRAFLDARVAQDQALLASTEIKLTDEERERIQQEILADTEILAGLLNEIAATNEDIASSSRNWLDGLREAIRENANRAIDWKRIWLGAIDEMESALAGALKSIQNGSRTVLEAAQDAIVGILDALLDELNQILAHKLIMWLLAHIPFAGGGRTRGGQIIPLAEGALARGRILAAQQGFFAKGPTLAAIAEQPGLNELVLPLPKGLRTQDLAAAIRRGGGRERTGEGDITISYSGPIYATSPGSIRDHARAVADAVRFARSMNHPFARES